MASTITNTILEVGDGVAIPVAVRSISERKDEVKFEAISPAGNPVEKRGTGISSPGSVGGTEFVDAVTGEIVGETELTWGVYGPDTNFYPVPKEAIDSLQITTPDSVRIEEFIPLADVPWERARASYYLATQSKASPLMRKPLKMLHDALEETQTAGIIRLVPRSKEHLAVVYAKHGGLLVTTLAWSAEFAQVRESAEAIDGVAVDPAATKMAVKLIKLLSAPAVVLDVYEDSKRIRTEEIVEAALAGEAIEVPETGPVPVVLDGDALMTALKSSIDEATSQKKSKASPSGKARRQRVAAAG